MLYSKIKSLNYLLQYFLLYSSLLYSSVSRCFKYMHRSASYISGRRFSSLGEIRILSKAKPTWSVLANGNLPYRWLKWVRMVKPAPIRRPTSIASDMVVWKLLRAKLISPSSTVASWMSKSQLRPCCTKLSHGCVSPENTNLMNRTMN